MKRYDEYKLTSLPWIPEIPSAWKIVKAKHLLNKERRIPSEKAELLICSNQGTVFKRGESKIGLVASSTDIYQGVHAGDLLIHGMDTWHGAIAVSAFDGMCTPTVHVCTSTISNISYIAYYLRALAYMGIYKAISNGIRQNTSDFRSWDKAGDIDLVVPTFEEQNQIVRYLDWKVSEINKLLHGYQKQIVLLNERRVAVINNAVTKGIRSSADMKSSDTNWMGDIPVHWKVEKVKQHFNIRKVIAGEEGYDVISITQQGLKIKDLSSNEGQMAQSYAKYQFVRPGDFAMNHMDLLTGYIGISEFFGVTSPDYRVFELTDTENCIAEYYLYVFQLGYKRKIFYGLGRGAANKGRWRMPAENFKNYDIPVPPIEEQREIVEYIDQSTKNIDIAICELEKQIELLREYRTRLISDVVTGQIDVRDVIIPDYKSEADDDIAGDDADYDKMESEVSGDE